MAIAKQESRFSPGVSSPVGATGLLQLMPATAEELAGETLTIDELREPTRNARLGARYLSQLLEQWQGEGGKWAKPGTLAVGEPGKCKVALIMEVGDHQEVELQQPA